MKYQSTILIPAHSFTATDIFNMKEITNFFFPAVIYFALFLYLI